ncbi:MAG: AI-2E family transporter [Clostridia bacterium]|nr:AI-2E family transporter [Clostridia bacterium]
MRPSGRLIIALTAAAGVVLLFPAIRTVAWQLGAAYLLMGAALPLCRLMERKLPASAAAGLSLMLLGAGAVGLLLALVPPLVTQFRQLSESLPALIPRWREVLAQGTAWLTARGVNLTALREELFAHFSSLAGRAVSTLAGAAAQLTRSAGKLFLAPLFAFYLLRDRRKICAWLLTLLPIAWRTRAVRSAREMKRETAAFLRGQLLISAAVGGLTALALLVTGTPGWLLLGLLMGVMELIPYVGPLLAGIPAVLLSLQHGWLRALWTLCALLAVQQTESSLLSPRLLSGATNLHPLAVLIVITAGGVLAGAPGMLFSLPLVVSVRGAVRGWR